MDFLLPGHAVDEFDPAPDIAVAKAFDDLLQTLDSRLRCIWVKPDAESFPVGGRWYIARFHSNPELSAYWVIQGDNGEYCEPQMRHFERLQAMDTWTGRRTYQDFVDARSAKKKAQAKQFEEKRREFREKLDERLRHINDARISVPSLPKPMLIERDKTLVLPDGTAAPTIAESAKPKALAP